MIVLQIFIALSYSIQTGWNGSQWIQSVTDTWLHSFPKDRQKQSYQTKRQRRRRRSFVVRSDMSGCLWEIWTVTNTLREEEDMTVCECVWVCSCVYHFVRGWGRWGQHKRWIIWALAVGRRACLFSPTNHLLLCYHCSLCVWGWGGGGR